MSIVTTVMQSSVTACRWRPWDVKTGVSSRAPMDVIPRSMHQYVKILRFTRYTSVSRVFAQLFNQLLLVNTREPSRPPTTPKAHACTRIGCRHINSIKYVGSKFEMSHKASSDRPASTAPDTPREHATVCTNKHRGIAPITSALKPGSKGLAVCSRPLPRAPPHAPARPPPPTHRSEDRPGSGCCC